VANQNTTTSSMHSTTATVARAIEGPRAAVNLAADTVEGLITAAAVAAVAARAAAVRIRKIARAPAATEERSRLLSCWSARESELHCSCFVPYVGGVCVNIPFCGLYPRKDVSNDARMAVMFITVPGTAASFAQCWLCVLWAFPCNLTPSQRCHYAYSVNSPPYVRYLYRPL
jgi:hypothetical protein